MEEKIAREENNAIFNGKCVVLSSEVFQFSGEFPKQSFSPFFSFCGTRGQGRKGIPSTRLPFPLFPYFFFSFPYPAFPNFLSLLFFLFCFFLFFSFVSSFFSLSFLSYLNLSRISLFLPSFSFPVVCRLLLFSLLVRMYLSSLSSFYFPSSSFFSHFLLWIHVIHSLFFSLVHSFLSLSSDLYHSFILFFFLYCLFFLFSSFFFFFCSLLVS